MLQKLQDFAEVCMLMALAVIGCFLLPLFCIIQAAKGNPLWFWSRFDKDRR